MAHLLHGEGRGRARGVAAHPLEHRQVPQPLPLRPLPRWAHVGAAAHDRRGVAAGTSRGGAGRRREGRGGGGRRRWR